MTDLSHVSGTGVGCFMHYIIFHLFDIYGSKSYYGHLAADLCGAGMNDMNNLPSLCRWIMKSTTWTEMVLVKKMIYLCSFYDLGLNLEKCALLYHKNALYCLLLLYSKGAVALNSH